MNADEERVAVGRAVYARNLAVDDARAEAMMTERAGPQFTREVYLVAGGPGWQSSALTERDRSIAIVAALVAQHVTDDRLVVYLQAARRSGVDEDGLTALMTLLAAYIGQPATSLTMAAVRRTTCSSRSS